MSNLSSVVLLDIVSFTQYSHDKRKALLKTFDNLVDEAGKFIMPRGNFRKKYKIHDTGDGCYIILDEITAIDALEFVSILRSGLDEHNRNYGKVLTPQLRITLGSGDVERLEYHLYGDVLAECERLISDQQFKALLKDSHENSMVFVTGLFYRQLAQDIDLDKNNKKEFPQYHELKWTRTSVTDKHKEEHIGFILGEFAFVIPEETEQEIKEARKLADAVKITVLIGGSIEDPLNEAVLFAHIFAEDISHMNASVSIRFENATRDNFKRCLLDKTALLVYVGHGTKDGELAFEPYLFGRTNLNELKKQKASTSSLKGAFIFACYGSLFAEHLECPWVAFDDKVKRKIPKDYMYELIRLWLDKQSLKKAVELVLEENSELKGELGASQKVSPLDFEGLIIEQGETVLETISSRMKKARSNEFYDYEQGTKGYPGIEPFVGRVEELKELLKFNEIRWIWGAPGIGKSALLVQFFKYATERIFSRPDNHIIAVHIDCSEIVSADAVKKALADAFMKLSQEMGVSRTNDLFNAPADSSKTILIILDDLSYIGIGSEKDAPEKLVREIISRAKNSSLRFSILASSRTEPAAEFCPLPELELLSTSDILKMANEIWDRQTNEDCDQKDLEAIRDLISYLEGNTARLKSAMVSAAVNKTPYSIYRDIFRDKDPESEEDRKKVVDALFGKTIEMLAGRESSDGFKYEPFLRHLFPMYLRTGPFNRNELEKWFGKAFVNDSASDQTDVYRKGLTTLSAAGFLNIKWVEKEKLKEKMYDMPANWRSPLAALSDGQNEESIMEIIRNIEPRNISTRITLAFELKDRNPEHAHQILDEIVDTYWKHTEEPEIAKGVAQALYLKSWTYSDEKKDKESIEIIDKLIEKFADRNELDIVKLVANALFNKGCFVERLYGDEAAIAVCDELIDKFEDRQEPGIAENVACALFNKGVCIGRIQGDEAEIGVYDVLIKKFEDRQEAEIAERVAKALFNTLFLKNKEKPKLFEEEVEKAIEEWKERNPVVAGFIRNFLESAIEKNSNENEEDDNDD